MQLGLLVGVPIELFVMRNSRASSINGVLT